MRTMRNLSVLILVVGAFFTIAGNAFAFCGPGFSNKAQAVAYYKTSAGAKFLPSLKTHLVADGFMSADQDVLAFFESDKTANVITPKGYTLSKNTSCKGSQYGPYAGLLLHSDKNVLAVIVGKTVHPIGNAKVVSTKTTKVKTVQSQVNQPDGSIKVYETTTYRETVTLQKKSTACVLYKPLEKGYCRNYVGGPVFTKCETKVVSYTQSKTYTKVVLVKTTPPPASTPTVNCPTGSVKDSAGNCVAVTVSCPTGTVKDSNGNCVTQTNTAAQACQAKGGNWDNTTQLCTIIQVNGTCSTIIVVNGNGNTVNTSTTGNCNTTTTPAPTFVCTGLSLSQSNLMATATVGVSTSGGASFKSATINWGDNQSTTNGLTQSHAYATGGTFGVSAVVTFDLPNSTTATANCSASVTVSTPPAPSAPSIITVTTINDVNATGSSPNFCVTVNVPGSDTGALIVSATYGSFSSGTVTVSGQNQYCFTYLAPSEVPPGGTDTVTVNLRDNTTGLSASQNSQTFPVHPRP